jgi:hypothetical protein
LYFGKALIKNPYMRINNGILRKIFRPEISISISFSPDGFM